MAIATTGEKNSLATKYAADALYASLHSAAPGASGANEISGGSPAYARRAVTWGTPTNGVITATVTFDVPSGVTVAGAGLWSAVTGGTFLDGGTLSSQTFGAQGTYQLSLAFTVS